MKRNTQKRGSKGRNGKKPRVKKTIVYPKNLRTGGFIGLESKYLDCWWNGNVVAVSNDGSSGEMNPTGGCAFAISVPSQGNGPQQREGRQYCITSAYVSGIIDFATTNDGLFEGIFGQYGLFFALVLDTQANGTIYKSEDVYVNPSGSVFAAMTPQPLRNLEHTKRFKILDKVYVEPANTIFTWSGTPELYRQTADRVLSFSLGWRGKIVVNTKGTANSISSVTDNAIHLLGYAGNNWFSPSFSGKSRIRFVG